MLITSKNFKWHDDLTPTWNIEEIQTQISTRVITNYAKHCQSRECIIQTEVLKSFPLSKNLTLIFHKKSMCIGSLASEYNMLN